MGYRIERAEQRKFFVECRKKLELSQKELGNLFNVSETTIRNIESGRNGTELAFEFAAFFEVNVLDLFPELVPTDVPERPQSMKNNELAY